MIGQGLSSLVRKNCKIFATVSPESYILVKVKGQYQERENAEIDFWRNSAENGFKTKMFVDGPSIATLHVEG